jgi:hypothetical protein
MNMLDSRDFIRSSESSHSAGPSRITIFVLFTGVGKTLDALWSAGRLARDLDAHIEIIVPYPSPLDEPPVLRPFGTTATGRSLNRQELIWNRALPQSLAERRSARLHTSILQTDDYKWFGSANGGRTRIRRLQAFPISC